MIGHRIVRASALALVSLAFSCGDEDIGNGQAPAGVSAPPLRGAIFTTTVDGSRVNANIYAAKTDVYLDGGPGQNAPSTAAALPAGDYFFQVTDPSGKVLLSSDHITCRRIHVNDSGVIDQVYRGMNYLFHNNAWEKVPCQHAQGVDQDHAELGAITVQLHPYYDTPNPGGVYKVWATPVESYTGNPAFVPSGRDDGANADNTSLHSVHGFVEAASKTDNFKVLPPAPMPPPPTPVCGNGIVEAGEECDDGNLDDFDGCTTWCVLCGVCGDGLIEMSEECDDGNRIDGDGCSSNCKLETPAG